jgi:hypothetical protein
MTLFDIIENKHHASLPTGIISMNCRDVPVFALEERLQGNGERTSCELNNPLRLHNSSHASW